MGNIIVGIRMISVSKIQPKLYEYLRATSKASLVQTKPINTAGVQLKNLKLDCDRFEKLNKAAVRHFGIFIGAVPVSAGQPDISRTAHRSHPGNGGAFLHRQHGAIDGDCLTHGNSFTY